MHTRHHVVLVAFYDATADLALYSDPLLASKARDFGHALGAAGIGAIARIGSPLVLSVLSSISENGAAVVALSPAASAVEHRTAFRLPETNLPLIYTGRGGLGTDVVAAASSSAVCVLGSDEEELLGIVGCIGNRNNPVVILTDESAPALHQKIIEHYPDLLHHLHISNNPQVLVEEISKALRQKQFQSK